MYKIGCVNIDTSHPACFAGKMKEFELDMRYSCIFNDGFRSDGEVENFMKNNSIDKRHESLEEMAREVDIAFIHDCNWDKHIEHAMPFIKAGKPVFIDKPVVGSLKDCLRLKELVKKGAGIIGSSSARYVECLADLKNKIAEAGEMIATVFGTSGVDEFNYGVHIMEGIHGLLGAGAYSTRYLGVSNSVNKPAEQYLTKWNNGVQVIYQTQTGQWQPFHVVVTTDKTIHHVQVDTGKLYISLLKKIEAFLKNGAPMASMDELVETVKIYLAGKKSREMHGQEIALQSLSVSDAGYDGYAFEKEYSIANIK